MTDYTELAKRLREYSTERRGEVADLTREAAEAIEALHKQIAVLKMWILDLEHTEGADD